MTSNSEFSAVFVCHVSGLILRFVEGRGSRYRMQVSALVHSVFDHPTRFEFDTWIERLPNV